MLDKRYKNREYSIIKEISHINCIKLINAYYTNGDKVYLFYSIGWWSLFEFSHGVYARKSIRYE